jgi:hypothetical protein
MELLIAGVAAVFLHVRSRKFVGRRLRYTTIVEKPALGLWTGAGATIAAAPLALLPVIGPFTAIAIGVGVGTGVALGVKDTENPPKLIED